MNINFLTGSLAYREHKTGVHFFHDMLIRKTIEHKKYNVNISFYNKEEEVRQYLPDYVCEESNQHFSNKFTRIFAYIFPIELIFGKSDIYICDGLIPIINKSKKRVAIVFDLMVKKFPNYYKPVMRAYMNFYFMRCRKADLILTISHTTKRDIVHYLKIPEDRIVVVPCGYVGTSNNGELTVEFAEKIKEKYIFYVGDMRKNKNLLNAIKGFEKAYRENSDIKFYIAGKKSGEYEDLNKYVIEHNLQNAVNFLGYISESEKIALYKNSLGLLFVSKYEGFGIPILEAAYYETPVITSNCSSMKEIAEECSILVDPNKPNEIKDAIKSLYNCDIRSDIIKKQKRLLDTYSWENMYSKFEKAIDSLYFYDGCV
ncbi:Glycosyltransferase involved in cell wall bisynthesis [Ruminococcus flavefaciens]|uniref:Glycosyltransferase involved in cell wall bisynthesis n=2 Tax=Ruminococcus flavefaciens TaxID=1265 RepID=A0A1H6ICU4_RUMFL|nr:Glycosyltransferase involved in cell wall bisynthesis [Ruminococcus flavefaciens]